MKKGQVVLVTNYLDYQEPQVAVVTSATDPSIAGPQFVNLQVLPNLRPGDVLPGVEAFEGTMEELEAYVASKEMIGRGKSYAIPLT